jgi:predicted P-loop ATPase
LTEGFFKAIAGCSNDLPTISVIGVEMGLTSAKSDPQGKRYLVPGLERLVKAGFGFIIGFDSDAATNSMVVNAQSKLAHQLKLFGCPVYSITGLWNIEEGKGIDDYIEMNGADKFKREILGKVINIEAWEAQFKTVGDDEKLSPTHKAWIQLEKIYGERIRWNEMSLRCEIDGKPARNLEGLYLDLELDYNIAISKEKTYDLMLRLARRRTYHPVKEYLERVASKIEPIDIDNLATRFLKTTDPIYDAMIKAHLIGSVKRTFEPGCKKDEALILQGKQGIGKSTFFTKLYGREFFSDSLKGTDRDNLLILHQYWCLELAEIESITSRREVGELKSFISAQSDTFRQPYGRSSEPHERQSVLVGTVNPDTFLQDETGNRRFWVIPVKSRIDTVELEKFRDAIWAAAVVAYRNGEPSILSQSEELLVNELNTNYIHQDSWHQIIENYLLQRQQTTTAEILEKALGVEVSRFDKRSEMRVATILRQMGWQKSRGTYLGKNMKFWQSSTLPTLSTLSTPPEEVGNHTGQGLCPPCPPMKQNLPATFDDVQDQQINSNKEKLDTEVDKVDKTHTEQGMPTSQPPLEEVDEVGKVGKTHTEQGMPTSQPLSLEVDKDHTQQGMPTSQPPSLEVDEVDEVGKTHTQQDLDPSPAPVTPTYLNTQIKNPYENPKVPFSSGQWVRNLLDDGKEYQVLSCTHTHAYLINFPGQVNVDFLEAVEK